jgi:hypothetical protein
MQQKFTNSEFHTSQILLSDRVRRYASWCSHTAYGVSIALSLSVFIPSKLEAKVIHICSAIAAYGISNRLDELVKLASGYEVRSHVQSETSYQQWLTHAMKPPLRDVVLAQPEIVESPTFYDWNNISDEAVGFLICGNSGSAKSSLATWLAGHLSQYNPMGVIALDPHFNDCWQLAGIPSIGKIEQIEAALNWLLNELDARCERKGNKQPLGDHLFIICDELNAALERFSDRKIVESTLRRLGSEGRKFGLTFCGLNQSSNAGAIGIDAKYRSNYALILLGQSARTHPQLGKHLTDVAYPCLLDGSIAPSLAVHPTHGDYKVFKKSGNPPKNLKQINQLPLPSGLLAAIDDRPIAVQMVESGLPPNVATALSTQPQSTAIAPVFQKIVNYLDGKDWKKDYEIKASIREFKDADTPLTELQGYLQFLETQNLLETRSTQRGALEARVIRDKTA